MGKEWPLQPQTLFYDWLYLNALNQNQDLASKICEYDGFTDIEFNPKKSINCQAYSAALYTSLVKEGKLVEALGGSDRYRKLIKARVGKGSAQQASLF